MTETLFEQFGGTYIKQGDYLIPNLTLPAEEEIGNIGVWAMRHKRYLKQHHKVLYYNLLTNGKMNSYLAATTFSPACERTCRERKSNRRTQSNRYVVVGAENE